MIRTLSILPLLCALHLMAQIELSNTPIRGEVKGPGSALATNLTIEAYDSSTHLRVGQTLVSVTGNFDLEALPRGNYELRLVSPTGQVLQTQSVNLNAPMQAVDFEIPKEKESKPASGSVDFSQLDHHPDPRAVKIFQKAIKAVARDDHKQAIELLQKTIEADPNFAEAHLNLAAQYAKTGDAARSLEESQIAARLAPGNWLARLNLAIVLFRLRRLPDAELEARAATRLDPANTKVAFLTGVILAGEGKITPETLFYLKKAYADYPQARELGAKLEKQLAR